MKKKKALWAPVLLSLSLLSACDVGERYERPKIDAPERYREAETPDRTEIDAAWWKAFQSPTLDRLMETALLRNQDMAAAAARVRQADAQRRIAGAGLLPSVDLELDRTRTRTPSRTGSAGAAYASSYGAALSASYEIDFWNANHSRLQSAEMQAAASRFDWRTVMIATQASVANGYFALLSDSERLAVAERRAQNAREVLDSIKDRERLGTATERDVAKQENLLAVAEAALPPLRQSLEQNANALRILTGDALLEIDPEQERLSNIAAPAISPGLPSSLLAQRPDVRAAEAALIAANADLSAARAALFPSIALTGRYGFESLALSSLLDQKSLLWSIATGLTQPIFRGGALAGDVALKEGVKEEMIADYRKIVIEALFDVENALIAVRRSGENLAAEGKVVDAARRSYEMSQDQFNAGVTDIIDLLDAQNSLYGAEDGLAQSRLLRIEATVGLIRALGGGWDANSPPDP